LPAKQRDGLDFPALNKAAHTQDDSDRIAHYQFRNPAFATDRITKNWALKIVIEAMTELILLVKHHLR
jgi:hypothetical protein